MKHDIPGVDFGLRFHEMTDDQLRAECERRWPPRMTGTQMGVIVAALAAKLDADDPAGACDVLDDMFMREWPQLPGKLRADVRGLVVAAYRDAAKSRDEWKAKYAALVGESRHTPAGRTLAQHLDITHRERDEWKRRAEAAEAELAERALVARERLTQWVDRERGPGIGATKPNNSVAWLDEDLLADDAP